MEQIASVEVLSALEGRLEVLLTDAEARLPDPGLDLLQRSETRTLADGSSLLICCNQRGDKTDYYCLLTRDDQDSTHDVWEQFNISKRDYLWSRDLKRNRIHSSRRAEEQYIYRNIEPHDEVRLWGLIDDFEQAQSRVKVACNFVRRLARNLAALQLGMDPRIIQELADQSES